MLDIRDKNSEKPIPEGSYPLDYRKIGEGEEAFKIFISEHILNDIKAFLFSDKERELGGVLLGEVYKDEAGREFVIVDEFVIALFTESNITRLTFTHSSWEYMNNKIDKEYPGKKIIGWFHSHPGHTVFLSGYDKFIHENFFIKNYNVAYVYDPINNDDGFFFMKDGALAKAGCYYVYSDIKTLNSEKKILQEKGVKEKKSKNSRPIIYVVLFFLILSIAISSMMIIKYTLINEKNEELNSKLKVMNDENTRIHEKLDKLLKNIQEDSLNSVKNLVKHQVRPGETLRGIAKQYYNDEGKYNLLVRQNNLKDEFDIAVGQIIEIPAGN